MTVLQEMRSYFRKLKSVNNTDFGLLELEENIFATADEADKKLKALEGQLDKAAKIIRKLTELSIASYDLLLINKAVDLLNEIEQSQTEEEGGMTSEEILSKHTGKEGIYLTKGMIRGSDALEAMEEYKDAELKEAKEMIDNCINIAKGCHDYGGGYRDEQEANIYHHGIQTVVNCLEAFKKKGLNDLQVRVCRDIGKSDNSQDNQED